MHLYCQECCEFSHSVQTNVIQGPDILGCLKNQHDSLLYDITKLKRLEILQLLIHCPVQCTIFTTIGASMSFGKKDWSVKQYLYIFLSPKKCEACEQNLCHSLQDPKFSIIVDLWKSHCFHWEHFFLNVKNDLRKKIFFLIAW